MNVCANDPTTCYVDIDDEVADDDYDVETKGGVSDTDIDGDTAN